MLIWTEPRKLQDVPGYKSYRFGGPTGRANSWEIARKYHKIWKAWKIRRKKGIHRVEVRKSIHGVAILIKAFPSGTIELSMNGTIHLNPKDQKELFVAIEEALKAVTV